MQSFVFCLTKQILTSKDQLVMHRINLNHLLKRGKQRQFPLINVDMQNQLCQWLSASQKRCTTSNTYNEKQLKMMCKQSLQAYLKPKTCPTQSIHRRQALTKATALKTTTGLPGRETPSVSRHDQSTLFV